MLDLKSHGVNIAEAGVEPRGWPENPTSPALGRGDNSRPGRAGVALAGRFAECWESAVILASGNDLHEMKIIIMWNLGPQGIQEKKIQSPRKTKELRVKRVSCLLSQ